MRDHVEKLYRFLLFGPHKARITLCADIVSYTLSCEHVAYVIFADTLKFRARLSQILTCEAGWNASVHEHLKFFKFVCDCNTTVVILNINLIRYVKTLFLHYNRWRQQTSSIFSLHNKENLSPFKAPLKDQNTGSAIRTGSDYGPIFGAGHDIFISNNAASNTGSYTNFNSNY